jgi:membrane-bound serine protease (ClpP class)
MAWIIGMLAAGAVLLMLEILTPTFGVLAMLAVVAFCVAVWACFLENMVLGFVVLIALMVAVPLYLIMLVKWLPKNPLSRGLFLQKAHEGEGEGVPDADSLQTLIGRNATTETPLRPAGMIRVNGRRLSALAEGDLIDAGQEVTIVRVNGSDVLVRTAES